jgi:alkylhydroperoxidase family enzyme
VVEGMLAQLGVAPEHITDVVTDEKGTLKPDEVAAVRYAEAVTKDAVEIPEEIWTSLKEHYDDAQIVELTAAISLFNYINRFNDALGVLPE